MLVLSGESTAEDVEGAEEKPAHVFASVRELTEALREAAAGCELNPIVVHDSNVSSQYIGNEYVSRDSMNSAASPALSWVPSPITRT